MKNIKKDDVICEVKNVNANDTRFRRQLYE